eukprot:m.369952 g.369952  ORF g.369952 m.369952 type:complete len:50 (+) comp51654_c0_seq1:80-229(+)
MDEMVGNRSFQSSHNMFNVYQTAFFPQCYFIQAEVPTHACTLILNVRGT